jgi:1-acyl-sn-glycerol-3-phosphate acyltransferase
VRRAGYIRNDLPAPAMLAACREALERGAKLIVFPEGTRSRPDAPPRFQRGFANIALASGAPVLPVLITCDPPTLAKGEPWWRVPPRRPLFRLRVGTPIDPAAFAALPRGLAARRMTALLEDDFRRWLAAEQETALSARQGNDMAVAGQQVMESGACRTSNTI